MKHKTLTYAPLLLCCVYLLLAFSDVLFSAVQDVSSNAFLTVSIVQFLVLLVPLFFYCGLSRRSFVKTVLLKPAPLRDIPFFLWAFCAFFFGAASLKFLTCAAFSQAAAETSSLIGATLYTTNTPLVILCFILLPAFLEQALFSGLILTEYQEYGKGIAVFFSALTYALAHFSLENFFFYFFCGMMFALISQVSGSVLPSVVLAALSAAADIYLEEVFFEYMTQTGTSALVFYFFCALFLFFSLLGVSYLEKSYARRARSVRESARVALEAQANRSEANAQGTRQLSFLTRLRLVFLSPVFLLLLFLFFIFATGIL